MLVKKIKYNYFFWGHSVLWNNMSMEGCWSDKRNVWCITSYFLPLPNFVVLCHCTCPFPWAFGCLYLILLKIKKITRKSLVLCYLILSFTLSSWIHVPASWMAHVTCFICCSIFLVNGISLLLGRQNKALDACLAWWCGRAEFPSERTQPTHSPVTRQIGAADVQSFRIADKQVLILDFFYPLLFPLYGHFSAFAHELLHSSCLLLLILL